MNYPSVRASSAEWKAWLEVVAPFDRPCHEQLHREMRFLSSIEDREFAALAAEGLVAHLRSRREIP